MEDIKAEMIRGVEVTAEEKALYEQGEEVGKRWAETTAEDDQPRQGASGQQLNPGDG